jgi:hypothetical protein
MTPPTEANQNISNTGYDNSVNAQYVPNAPYLPNAVNDNKKPSFSNGNIPSTQTNTVSSINNYLKVNVITLDPT